MHLRDICKSVRPVRVLRTGQRYLMPAHMRCQNVTRNPLHLNRVRGLNTWVLAYARSRRRQSLEVEVQKLPGLVVILVTSQSAAHSVKLNCRGDAQHTSLQHLYPVSTISPESVDTEAYISLTWSRFAGCTLATTLCISMLGNPYSPRKMPLPSSYSMQW